MTFDYKCSNLVEIMQKLKKNSYVICKKKENALKMWLFKNCKELVNRKYEFVIVHSK